MFQSKNPKEAEIRQLSEWVANLFGTCRTFVENDFWSMFPDSELKEVQGNLFYRAFEVVNRIDKDGKGDVDSIIKYMYGHAGMQRAERLLNEAYNEMKPIAEKIISVVVHRLKYADSKILVPPIIEQQLLSGPDYVRARCMAYLKSRGIDTTEYLSYLEDMFKADSRVGAPINKITDEMKRQAENIMKFDKDTLSEISKQM